MKPDEFLKGGKFTVEKQPASDFLGGGKFTIDQSSATLAHSQASIDQLRQRETEAKAASDKANSFGTLATQTAGGAVDSLFGGLRKTVKSGIQAVGEAFGSKAPSEQYTSLTGEPQQTYQADLEQGKGSVGGAFGNMAFDAATALPLGKGASLVKEGAEAALGSKALSPIVDMVKKPLAKLSGFLTGRADKKAVEALQQTLAPKLTPSEVKIALKEGRIVPGKDPSLLRGGTPDEIVPSDVTNRAVETIRRQIPNAEKLKPSELYSAVDTQVKNMGQSLRPVMDTTPLKPETVGKITKDWEALKKKQLSDPYTPATANVRKLQADFENNFLKKSKSQNFGDLWDTRIAYDASVPSNVKNATSLSSDALQTQKEIWLQNRRILNDAMNDSSSGLGDVSGKTFQEMNDMYNAQKGIESSFKPTKEGLPSKAVQFAKNNKLLTGVAALEANKISKDVTGIGIPTPF